MLTLRVHWLCVVRGPTLFLVCERFTYSLDVSVMLRYIYPGVLETALALPTFKYSTHSWLLYGLVTPRNSFESFSWCFFPDYIRYSIFFPFLFFFISFFLPFICLFVIMCWRLGICISIAWSCYRLSDPLTALPLCVLPSKCKVTWGLLFVGGRSYSTLFLSTGIFCTVFTFYFYFYVIFIIIFIIVYSYFFA
jgi:hypothetical protein